MNILESYKKIAKNMLIEHAWDRKFGEPLPTLEDVMKEADDDKYVSIGYGRYKLKGKEDDDDADVFTKTDSGQYEKSADQKSDDDDKGGEEKPSGGSGMGPEDFERDFDDSEPEDKPHGGDTGVDADFGMDDDDIEDDEEARAQAFADMEDELGDEEEWDESIKVINGKKYRAIKESIELKKKQPMKEMYKRIGGE